jgi:hypothetical protein
VIQCPKNRKIILSGGGKVGVYIFDLGHLLVFF